MEAELLSGELRIVRPPSPDSMPPGAVKVSGSPAVRLVRLPLRLLDAAGARQSNNNEYEQHLVHERH